MHPASLLPEERQPAPRGAGHAAAACSSQAICHSLVEAHERPSLCTRMNARTKVLCILERVVSGRRVAARAPRAGVLQLQAPCHTPPLRIVHRHGCTASGDTRVQVTPTPTRTPCAAPTKQPWVCHQVHATNDVCSRTAGAPANPTRANPLRSARVFARAHGDPVSRGGRARRAAKPQGCQALTPP